MQTSPLIIILGKTVGHANFFTYDNRK